jgi:hypothetical protein
VEIALAKLNKYKSSGSDQIPAELIQAGGEILLTSIHKLINKIIKLIKLNVIIIVRYHCYQLHTKFYGISSSQEAINCETTE